MNKLNQKYADSILLTLFLSSNSLANPTHSVGVGVGVNNTSVDIINLTSPGIAYEHRSSDSLALEVGLYFGGSDGIASGSAAAAVEINALASTKLK